MDRDIYRKMVTHLAVLGDQADTIRAKVSRALRAQDELGTIAEELSSLSATVHATKAVLYKLSGEVDCPDEDTHEILSTCCGVGAAEYAPQFCGQCRDSTGWEVQCDTCAPNGRDVRDDTYGS